MTLKETIIDYLDTISESSKESYKTKLDMFMRFLENEKQIIDRSFQSYIEAMKIEEIMESLDYYIICNNIKSQSIAWHYCSVIKRYFNHIYELGFDNAKLIKSFGQDEKNPESYQSRIREKIFNDIRLEKKEQKSELELQELRDLISECNEEIRELIEEDLILDYKKYSYKYNDLMSSIIIKLMLLTGVKYVVVRNIKFSKYNILDKIIGINGYTLILPDSLNEQIAYYCKLRYEIQKRTKKHTDSLFIMANGEEIRSGTDIVADTLKKYIGRSDVTGIIKSAVIQMISKDTNNCIIQELTEMGPVNYKYCQKKVFENPNISKNEYLNSKLRSLEIFHML